MMDIGGAGGAGLASLDAEPVGGDWVLLLDADEG